MRFDLLSLKLFVIVCEQQSISRTADVERIAASAVSKRMSDLEAMVKTPLFLRSQKGLDMTPAAHDLLKHARVVLRDLGQLENDMLDHSKGRRGDVRLHACHSPIAQHLPGDLANFLGLNPAIRVSIDEGLAETAAAERRRQAYTSPLIAPTGWWRLCRPNMCWPTPRQSLSPKWRSTTLSARSKAAVSTS